MPLRRILPPAQPLWYSIMVLVGGLGILVAAGMFYTRYKIHESEQKLCAVVASMDDTYRQRPPTTETGRRIAMQMHRLRQDLGCPAKVNI